MRGVTVHMYDYDSIKVQKIHSIIAEQLDELRAQGLLHTDHKLQGTLIADSILSSAVTDADIVIEAIKEDVTIKNKFFKDIAPLCSKETIFSTSSISLSLADIFADVPHQERALGLRFLYPVYLIDTCEMTFMDTTSSETISKVHGFLKSVGKTAHCRVPGFPRKLTQEEAWHIQQGSSRTELGYPH